MSLFVLRPSEGSSTICANIFFLRCSHLVVNYNTVKLMIVQFPGESVKGKNLTSFVHSVELILRFPRLKIVSVIGDQPRIDL